MDKLTGKGKDFMALRKIRSYLPAFEPSEWVSEAQDTYQASHQALVDRDLDKLYSLATEKALPEMLCNVANKTIRWQLLRSLEPARVVHVRTEEIGQGMVFAQLTVRFHTQQTLAVFDRFGRLMHGSEAIVKDVLDYVVFERSLSDQYGQWRIHAKLIPEWNERQSFSRFTSVKPEVTEEDDESPAESNSNQSTASTSAVSN
jgi:large subunit ribosomal protein L45